MHTWLQQLQNWLGFPQEDSAANIAKNRLKVVLVHDRIRLTPEELENLKKDLITVLSKYVAIDKKQVDVALSQRGKATSLIANIPLKSRKPAS